MSIRETADYFGVGPTTVWGLIAAKKIKSVRVGRKRRIIRLIDARAYLQANAK